MTDKSRIEELERKNAMLRTSRDELLASSKAADKFIRGLYLHSEGEGNEAVRLAAIHNYCAGWLGEKS